MFLPVSRPPSRPPHRGRCFRTDADGRIALAADFPRLLRTLARVGRVAVQTRHASARLVAVVAPSSVLAYAGSSDALLAADDGVVRCQLGRWRRAWGFLSPCPCCSSPGRVEIQDETGAELLQFCALPGSDPHGWSDYLDAVASPVESGAENPSGRGAGHGRLPLPAAHVWLPFDLDGLLALLAALGSEGLAVRCTLRTGGACHARDLVPRCCHEQDGLIDVGQPGAHFQLAAPAARGLAFTSDATGPALHVVGRDDTILLSFSAALDPLASTLWQRALGLAFPALP